MSRQSARSSIRVCFGVCPIHLADPWMTKLHSLNNITLKVYRPNTIRYETKAYVCRIVRKVVYYYTNFFNVKFSRTEVDNIFLSAYACRSIIHHKTCKFGNLVLKGEVYQTENSLNIDFPYPIIGSFHERKIEATNCYLFDFIVSVSFEGDLQSPVGPVEGCKYEEGACSSRDNTVLIWTPEPSHCCRFIKVQRWQGQLLDNIWLSDSKEFSLSFSNFSQRINDCGLELILTDQAYAVNAMELSQQWN